jgi:hypothetical protein
MREILTRTTTAGLLALTATVAACGYDSSYTTTGPGTGDSAATYALRADATVFRASGDLTLTLTQFRAGLGDSVNRTAGEQASGRREINWDGVSGALLNVDTFPADFFNRVLPRGQVYSTEGTGFRVSDNALADLNPRYGSEFAAFSPTRIFVAAGSRTTTVHFFVAGSTTRARVSGFGVVFSDVDVEGGTTLSYFDARGRLLRTISAPARSDVAGFSFAGAIFAGPVVATVRIQAGTGVIAGSNNDISAGGDRDLVAMDDFISGEPHAAH